MEQNVFYRAKLDDLFEEFMDSSKLSAQEKEYYEKDFRQNGKRLGVIERYKALEPSLLLRVEALKKAMKETVKKRKLGRNARINRFKKFVQFLELKTGNYNIAQGIAFPPTNIDDEVPCLGYGSKERSCNEVLSARNFKSRFSYGSRTGNKYMRSDTVDFDYTRCQP